MDTGGRGARVREGVLEAKSQSGNVVRLPRDSTHSRVAVKGGLEPAASAGTIPLRRQWPTSGQPIIEFRVRTRLARRLYIVPRLSISPRQIRSIDRNVLCLFTTVDRHLYPAKLRVIRH